MIKENWYFPDGFDMIWPDYNEDLSMPDMSMPEYKLGELIEPED